MPLLTASDRATFRRNAGPAAWWGAGTLVVALTGIHVLMRGHEHGLAAEPRNQEPGPKPIGESAAL